MINPYNPLDRINLGRSVAEALLSQPATPLSESSSLIGAGIYAIYYAGNFEPYRPLAAANNKGIFKQPIYVGKAVPKGARKGGLSFDASKGRALRDRLRQHASSIAEVSNLELSDFFFRSIVVDDIWIPLGENVLIEEFQPVWNLVIDGFGNKDPGNRRATQLRSLWDTLHPGRFFAEKLADNHIEPITLEAKLAEYFAGKPVPLIPVEAAVDVGFAEDDEEED